MKLFNLKTAIATTLFAAALTLFNFGNYLKVTDDFGATQHIVSVDLVKGDISKVVRHPDRRVCAYGMTTRGNGEAHTLPAKAYTPTRTFAETTRGNIESYTLSAKAFTARTATAGVTTRGNGEAHMLSAKAHTARTFTMGGPAATTRGNGEPHMLVEKSKANSKKLAKYKLEAKKLTGSSRGITTRGNGEQDKIMENIKRAKRAAIG